MFLYFFVISLLWLPFRILYPSRIIKKKNRPKKRGILSCNHLSLIDPVIIAVHTRRRLHFFAKKELAKNRLLRAAVPAVGSVFVSRGEADIAAVKKVLTILKNENVLVIFPEGRRNKDSEDMQELKAGAVMFSIKTDTPITPVILWRRPKLLRRNFIYYGNPVSFAEFKGVKMTHEHKAEANAILTGKMLEAREELNAYLKEKRSRMVAGYERRTAKRLKKAEAKAAKQ